MGILAWFEDLPIYRDLMHSVEAQNASRRTLSTSRRSRESVSHHDSNGVLMTCSARTRPRSTTFAMSEPNASHTARCSSGSLEDEITRPLEKFKTDKAEMITVIESRGESIFAQAEKEVGSFGACSVAGDSIPKRS